MTRVSSDLFRQAEVKLMREDVMARGRDGLHHISPELLDEMPHGSYLMRSTATFASMPMNCVKLVRVRQGNFGKHPRDYYTPGNRLLLCLWLAHPEPKGVKMLLRPIEHTRWLHAVMPDDPRYKMVDAFMVAAEHRRNKSLKPTLLYRALGLT